MNDNDVTPGGDASRRPHWERSGPAELKQQAESRPAELYEAAEQLCRTAFGEGPEGPSAARAVGRIADALADTRSRDCAKYAVDNVGLLVPLGSERLEEGDRLRRSVAAKLVKTQQLRDLEALFGELPERLDDPAVEVRACILGELAMIGAGRGRLALDAYAVRRTDHGRPFRQPAVPGQRPLHDAPDAGDDVQRGGRLPLTGQQTRSPGSVLAPQSTTATFSPGAGR